jgi:hypothetical protein
VPNKVVQIQASYPLIIAPCGIDCSLCRAYIRAHKPCSGCRGDDSNKSNACLTCVIRNCEGLAAGRNKFCVSCAKYPCADLLHLDRRYRTRYRVSVIENLGRIQTAGVRRFVAEEATKWSCSKCGSRFCMHKSDCVNCGQTRQVK